MKNLRDVTQLENRRNIPLKTNNDTVILGVEKDKSTMQVKTVYTVFYEDKLHRFRVLEDAIAFIQKIKKELGIIRRKK